MRDVVQLAFDYVKDDISTRLFSKKDLIFEAKPLFPIMFGIDPHWDIKVISRPDADEIFEEVIKKHKVDYEFPILSVMEWGLNHEKGHWDHCPFDINNFERIFNGTVRSLDDMGKDYKKDLLLTKNMMNIFMDIIDNTANMYQEISPLYKDGFDTFYLTEAVFQKNMIKDYSTTSELFMSTQYAFYGDESDLEQAVKSHFRYNTKPKGIKKYIKKFKRLSKKAQEFNTDLDRLLKIYTPNETCYEKVKENNIDNETKEEISKYIRDPSQWEKMAYEFTNIMYKHLKDVPYEQPSNSMMDQLIETIQGEEGDPSQGEPMDGQGQPGQEQPGEGQPEEGDDDDKGNGQDEGESDDKNDDKNQPGQSPGEAEPDDKDDGKSALDKAIQDMKETHENLEHKLNQEFVKLLVRAGRGEGANIDYADQFTYFDTVYQDRAEDIVFDFTAKLSESDVTRLAFFNHEPVEGNIDLSKIDYSKTRIIRNPAKKIILYEGDIEEVSDDPIIFGKGENFDLLWLLDSSGSMGMDSWGNIERQLKEGEGKYDLVLRSMYSSVKFLEKTGKAYRMNYGLVNFSESTKFSGWHDYENLDEVKKTAFKFQGGGTYLDPKKLKKVWQSRKENFLAFLLTDGDFHNPYEASRALKTMIEHGNPLIICYIDSKRTGYNNLIDNMGKTCKSHIISDPKDLIDLKLKTTEEVWGGMGDIFGYD